MAEFMLVTCSSARVRHTGGPTVRAVSAPWGRTVKPDPSDTQRKGMVEG